MRVFRIPIQCSYSASTMTSSSLHAIMFHLLTIVILCLLRGHIAHTAALKESNSMVDDLASVIQNAQPLGNEAPVDVLLKLILLILDVFTTASGSYFVVRDLGTTLNEEEQQHAIAIASTNLWMKLPYVLQMEEIFFNASQLTLSPLLAETPNRMENIHNDMLNNIEVQIQANSSLYKMYNREKHRVEEQDLPRLQDADVDFGNVVPIYALRKLIVMLSVHPALQYFIVHAQFASYARGASLVSRVNSTVQNDYYAVAKSLLSLANEPKIGQRVQVLYDKALRKTVETVKRLLKTGDEVLDADQILFPEIEKVFSWEPDLSTELARAKKTMLEKRTDADSLTT